MISQCVRIVRVNRVHYQPSGHIALKQRRFNVDLSSGVATLFQRCLLAGKFVITNKIVKLFNLKIGPTISLVFFTHFSTAFLDVTLIQYSVH